MLQAFPCFKCVDFESPLVSLYRMMLCPDIRRHRDVPRHQ